jgi:ATP-dependent protease ClpP protease subunit
MLSSATVNRQARATPATGRALILLLSAIAALAAARGLIWISDREFWWEFPRWESLLFLVAYFIGLTGAGLALISASRLLFDAEGLRQGVGLVAVAALSWVLYNLTMQSARDYVATRFDTVSGNVQPAQVRYEREARLIRLSGALERGSAVRFKEVLSAAPDARLVDVSGPGGLIYEARWISRMIEQRGLDTMVSTECHSACVDIFAAGTRRLMYTSAIVGLHSARSFTGGVAEDANRAFNQRLYKIGVEPRFLLVGSDTPPDDIWINSARKAYLAGLATEVVGP